MNDANIEEQTKRGLKLDEDPATGAVDFNPILEERMHGKDYQFVDKNNNPIKALNQLFLLRYLYSGNKICLDTLVDYLGTKNIRIDTVQNEKGSSFLVVRGLSLTPLKEYEVQDENKFFLVDTLISSIARDVFKHNGIIQLASEIGGGKTTYARSIMKRVPAKLYLEIRPNQKIRVESEGRREEFLKDDLALKLLYAHPKDVYALFNLYKSYTRRLLFEYCVEELRSGTYTGLDILDRSREEDILFLDMAFISGLIIEKDYYICKKVIMDEISAIDVGPTAVIRLLRPPESCYNLIQESRKRDAETGKPIPVSDAMNRALNELKYEMLNVADKYNTNVEALLKEDEKDAIKKSTLRDRYSEIFLSTKVTEIVPMPVSLEYCKNLHNAYKEFINTYKKTGFRDVIVNLDVQEWGRVNNCGQEMKLTETTVLAMMLEYMHKGYEFEFKDNRLRMKLPSLSHTILIGEQKG